MKIQMFLALLISAITIHVTFATNARHLRIMRSNQGNKYLCHPLPDDDYDDDDDEYGPRGARQIVNQGLGIVPGSGFVGGLAGAGVSQAAGAAGTAYGTVGSSYIGVLNPVGYVLAPGTGRR